MPTKRRANARIAQAIKGKQSSSSYRAAAKKHSIPHSTLYNRMKKPTRKPRRKPALSDEEVRAIVQFLTHYANKRVPLTQNHPQKAAALYSSQLSPSRQEKLPFRNGVPGQASLKNFRKRHMQELKFGNPTRQEASRYRAVNADYLSTHFATLEKLIEDNDIDAPRIFNLDELGAAPDKDINAKTAAKRLLARHSSRDVRLQNFAYRNRIKMMPVFSAEGEIGPTLFIFEGKRLPVRRVMKNGREIVETPLCNLPSKSCCALRDDVAGVDSENFLNWASSFVEYTAGLRENDRKVLLVYDGYRAHLSLAVLQLFVDNDIVVYALPAHTSGKTQPCDVVMFGAFKEALNKVSLDCIALDEYNKFDLFDYCSLLKHAFFESFTRKNIQSGFRRAGMWPVSGGKLLNVPRPASAEEGCQILSGKELVHLYEARRVEVRNSVLGLNAVVAQGGFIDTTKGCVMTSPTAMRLAKERLHQNREKHAAAVAERQRKDMVAEQRRAVALSECWSFHQSRAVARARLTGESVQDYSARVRSLAQRRAIARMRTIAKKRAMQRN